MDNYRWGLSRNYNGDDWRINNISGDSGVGEMSMNRVRGCGKAVDKLWKSCG